jgi:hypothetical protein
MHLSVNVRGEAGGDEFRGDEPASQKPRAAASSSSSRRPLPLPAGAEADADETAVVCRTDADTDCAADERAGEPCADAVEVAGAVAAAGAPAAHERFRPQKLRKDDIQTNTSRYQ